MRHSVLGDRVILSLFGESHGEGVGATLHGIPAGIPINEELIKFHLDRRRPGKLLTSQRQELDEYEVLSGVFQGVTTGAPITVFFKNKNCRSGDYEKSKNIFRPSHADYAAFCKYHGANDYRGGGHFSARLTAPIVFFGSLCRQILESKEIYIGSHLFSIGPFESKSWLHQSLCKEQFDTVLEKSLPIENDESYLEMSSYLKQVQSQGDSTGGVVEVALLNLSAGIGDPFFHSLESELSAGFFSIPGVKGVEFGGGFSMCSKRGHEVNDSLTMVDNKVVTKSNYSGGIQGGISNGMPIIARVAFKPTASIYQEQQSIDKVTHEPVLLKIEGRHDPCIALRAPVIVESIMAIVIANFMI